MRIRPFIEHLLPDHEVLAATGEHQGAAAAPALEIRGAIEGASFVVYALGHRIELETVELGEDPRGPYAVVKEGDLDLAGGFKIRVEIEPSPDGLHGGSLDFYLEGAAKEMAKQAMRAQGFDLDNVHLVMPDESSFSLGFNSDGRTNGTSGMYRLARLLRQPAPGVPIS